MQATAGIDQRQLPGFSLIVVHFDLVVCHLKGQVGRVKEVVSEVLFNDVALVAKADYELIDAVGTENLHDVPEDWFAPDVYHGFRSDFRFFRQSRAAPAG